MLFAALAATSAAAEEVTVTAMLLMMWLMLQQSLSLGHFLLGGIIATIAGQSRWRPANRTSSIVSRTIGNSSCSSTSTDSLTRFPSRGSTVAFTGSGVYRWPFRVLAMGADGTCSGRVRRLGRPD